MSEVFLIQATNEKREGYWWFSNSPLINKKGDVVRYPISKTDKVKMVEIVEIFRINNKEREISAI